MRKNKWFKMGAGLTAALMLCGSVSVVAFADEADAAAPAAEETVAEEVVTEEVAEEEVADIGDIVIEGVGDAADSDVAPEQEIRRTPSEDEEEVSLAAESVNGDGIVIGDIAVTHGGDEDPYYTVKVPYTYSGGEDNADITIFAYDITSIIEGNPSAGVETEYSVDTPVGWVNQEDVQTTVTPTLTFKVAKKVDGASLAADSNIAAFDAESTILIKVGGTGIEAPAAKIFSFENAEEVQGFQGTYGNVDSDNRISAADARQIYMWAFSDEKPEQGSDEFTAADVNGNTRIEAADARLVYSKAFDSSVVFPVEEQ